MYIITLTNSETGEVRKDTGKSSVEAHLVFDQVVKDFEKQYNRKAVKSNYFMGNMRRQIGPWEVRLQFR